MRQLLLCTAFGLVGCVGPNGLGSSSSELQSCSSPAFSDVTFYAAGDLDTPPVVVGPGGAQSYVEYPYQERQRGVQGVVTVRFGVSTDGAVMCSDVARGVSSALDEAARQAIHRTVFEPGLLDGRPVVAVTELPITFRIRQKDT